MAEVDELVTSIEHEHRSINGEPFVEFTIRQDRQQPYLHTATTMLVKAAHIEALTKDMLAAVDEAADAAEAAAQPEPEGEGDGDAGPQPAPDAGEPPAPADPDAPPA